MILTPMTIMLDVLAYEKATWFDVATLNLFQNNYVPVKTSNTGNFTPCTFTGYAPIVLGVWTGPVDNGSGRGQIAEVLRTFLCTAGSAQNIYGWYITKGGLLVCAQRDSGAPYAISPGLTYSVLPIYQDDNIP